MFSCWKCGQSVELPAGGRVGQRDSCPQCDSDLHSCRNCRFYDPGKHNQCSEPQAEWVRDKEAANYCDYFAPRLASSRASSAAEDVRRKFDSLFKI
jgi:hypothetical protein